MINFLISINKISLIAFLITFGFLIYEIILLKKESNIKKKLNLPKFSENFNNNLKINEKNIKKKREITINKPNNIIIFLIIISFLFGIITLISFFETREKKEVNTTRLSLTPTPIIEFVNSKGIRIFDENFNPILEENLNKIKKGDRILIGVETVPEAEIDRARIRVNKENWEDNDITLNFSKKFNVFYKEYQIATETNRLKIEAQLHSKEDGWLGE